MRPKLGSHDLAHGGFRLNQENLLTGPRPDQMFQALQNFLRRVAMGRADCSNAVSRRSSTARPPGED
jgi:hypothetical protein